MNPPKKAGHGMPGWLAVCFGLVGLAEPSAQKAYFDENKPAPVESKKPTPPKSPKPPSDWKKIPLVTQYDLIKMIGKGGFSEIWLSEHKRTRERVAIKVVQLTCADLEPEEVSTLLAEAKFLRTLDCPYLVQCRDTAATPDWLVLVLEYCAGGEVLDHLHKVQRYSEAEAAKLFAQIVSAISYLHNLNLMHRDIKPENVMFVSPVEECEAQGRPLRIKVIDLGMAALYDPSKQLMGCVGTPGFVAPEVWNDKPQTPAMDIYSLGVMLFVMLTGRKPHSGADIRRMGYCSKSIHDAPGLKDERFLSLSPSARALLLSMLADDPQSRPSCRDVLGHPFITAVDSNQQAHREMSAEVRRRIRDLHRIRRLHGLGYAMHNLRPPGPHAPASSPSAKEALLQALEQRRMRLKGEMGFLRESCSGVDSEVGSGDPNSFPRNSLCGVYEDAPGNTGTGPNSGDAGSHKGHRGLGGRPSLSGGGGQGGGQAEGGGGGVVVVDKLALLSALPGMHMCATMPPRRYAGPHPSELSPVASCDPSAYGNMEEAGLPRNWSAHPVMYEALMHREELLGLEGDRGEGGLGEQPAVTLGPSLPDMGPRTEAAQLLAAPLSMPREPDALPGPQAPPAAQPVIATAPVATAAAPPAGVVIVAA